MKFGFFAQSTTGRRILLEANGRLAKLGSSFNRLEGFYWPLVGLRLVAQSLVPKDLN